MAIPFEGRLEVRLTAPFHVQIELEKWQNIQGVAGDTEVRGRVVRVFRTDGRLPVGDPVAFTLWACDPGDEPTGPAYIYFDDLMTASYVEAYLYGDPPKCKLGAYEFGVIPAPSDEPTLTARELEGLLARFANPRVVAQKVLSATNWWQFWRR